MTEHDQWAELLGGPVRRLRQDILGGVWRRCRPAFEENRQLIGYPSFSMADLHEIATALPDLIAAARSQGEGEPVAWALYWRHGVTLHLTREDAEAAPGRTVQDPVPLYAHPQASSGPALEDAMVDHLRTLGCKCAEPLIGYRPGVGPRCRLCNVEPASSGEGGSEEVVWLRAALEEITDSSSVARARDIARAALSQDEKK